MIIVLTITTSLIINLKTDKKSSKENYKQTISNKTYESNNNKITEQSKFSSENSESANNEELPKKFIFPTSGEIILNYTKNELIYNHTTKDWRVHNGIDFEIAENGLVKSMNDGKVLSISNSDLYGNTIEIQHKNDIIIKYCNIKQCEEIKVGTIINQGMLIGYIKTNPPIESDQILHLHIEIYKNGKISDLSVLEF